MIGLAILSVFVTLVLMGSLFGLAFLIVGAWVAMVLMFLGVFTVGDCEDYGHREEL